MEIAAVRLGVPRQKLHVESQPVDEHFWRPEPESPADLICGVGREARDYGTLIRAARGLELDVELAIGTISAPPPEPTTKLPSSDERLLDGEPLPPNVRVGALDFLGLRRLYARSRFAVIPLLPGEYDPGVTATVEAMAMGRAVITTRIPGNRELFDDGVQGIYVPAGDARALRGAIEHLARNPDEAERMGRAGRALIEARHTLDAWIAWVSELVRGVDRGR